MSVGLSEKQEKFAQEVVRNGGDKVAALKASGYAWENYTKNALSVQSDKIYNKPKTNLRIKELQEQADAIAKEKFAVTIEQRLDWIKQVAEAGLTQHKDETGNLARFENLAATNKAVEILNTMLGLGDDGNTGETIAVTFEVSAPVREVKVTNAKS